MGTGEMGSEIEGRVEKLIEAYYEIRPRIM